MGIAIAVLLGCTLLSGLWLLVRGLRGDRVTPRRVCRGCRFDLHGLVSGQCPECGAALTGAASVRVLSRRRRASRAAVGGVLILLALAGPLSVVIDSALSGRLTRTMPDWALLVQLELMGISTPRRVGEELVARCVAGSVSNRALSAGARTAVRLQAARRNPDPSLAQLIGDAAEKGLISKDEFAAAMVWGEAFSAETSERVSVGDPFVNGLVTTGNRRLPPDGKWVWCVRIDGVEVDGVAQPMREAVNGNERSRWLVAHTLKGMTVSGEPYPSAAGGRAPVPAAAATSPGEHVVRVRYAFSALLGPSDTNPGRASLTTAYKVRVMREGQPLVTLSKDGSFKAAVVAGMGVLLSARQGELNGWGFTLNGKPVAPPPGAEGLRAGGAWDVYVELEGKRTQLGSTKVCWDEPNHQYQFWRGSVTLPPGVTRVRVVLAPNPRLAAVRTAIDVMPDGEIVIDDVEVRR